MGTEAQDTLNHFSKDTQEDFEWAGTWIPISLSGSVGHFSKYFQMIHPLFKVKKNCRPFIHMVKGREKCIDDNNSMPIAVLEMFWETDRKYVTLEVKEYVRYGGARISLFFIINTFTIPCDAKFTFVSPPPGVMTQWLINNVFDHSSLPRSQARTQAIWWATM